jgi:hypothetical protein
MLPSTCFRAVLPPGASESVESVQLNASVLRTHCFLFSFTKLMICLRAMVSVCTVATKRLMLWLARTLEGRESGDFVGHERLRRSVVFRNINSFCCSCNGIFKTSSHAPRWAGVLAKGLHPCAVFPCSFPALSPIESLWSEQAGGVLQSGIVTTVCVHSAAGIYPCVCCSASGPALGLWQRVCDQTGATPS